MNVSTCTGKYARFLVHWERGTLGHMATKAGKGDKEDQSAFVAERLRILRESLGWSQEKVADRSNGILDRTEVVKLEGGITKGKSYAARAGLAAAFGCSVEEISQYLDGESDLGTLKLAIQTREAKPSLSVKRWHGIEDIYPNRADAIAAAILLDDGYTEADFEKLRARPGFENLEDAPTKHWAMLLALIKEERVNSVTTRIGTLIRPEDRPRLLPPTRKRP